MVDDLAAPLGGGVAVGLRLPVQLTSFVGRGAELAELRRLVRDHRLVTLTGAGGVGKTRLALQLAYESAHEFADGTWWVDLAPITDPHAVANRVAHTLGLHDRLDKATVDAVAGFVADQNMLVLLDNCEHLLDACADLVTTLLGACPALTIAATSREPIRVAGELTWPTPPLSLAGEATELFTQRARLARPDFTGTADNATVMAEICRRLDGLPLAIELAASRVRALSLTEIADGLRDRFGLLTSGARGVVARQQTLRASVEWSHALLSEAERVVFRRLAVFRGGFDLDAAHAVAGGAELSRYQIIDGLRSLVDKSLLIADSTGDATRYWMLETIRHYALEKLDQSGEADAVRTRHRDHYTALFDTPASAGPRWRIKHADTEIDNLRAAFAWSLELGDTGLAAQLASTLQPLWIHSRTAEGLAWLDAVLTADAAMTPAARARALADKVILQSVTGAYYRIDDADHAVAIAREIGDPVLLFWALAARGVTCCYSPEVALSYFAEVAELAPALGDGWRLSQIFLPHAFSAFLGGELTTARQAAEKGRDLANAVGNGPASRLCRLCLGLTDLLCGDLTTASAQARRVTADAKAARDLLSGTQGLTLQGVILGYQGDLDGARAAAEAGIEAAATLPDFQRAASLGGLVDAMLAAGDVPAALAASDAVRDACALPQLQAVNGIPVARAALAAGDIVTARSWVDEALPVASGAHRMAVLAVRARLAIAEGVKGAVERAERDARDALAIAAETGAHLLVPDVIEFLATVATDSGRRREAARLFGSAQAMRDRTGQIRYKIYDADCAIAIDTLRNTMGRKDFADEWEEGAKLSTADAIAYGRRGDGERQRPSHGWASLTPTERNIARLIGEQLRNKEIAAELSISLRTVETHITRIYDKLGLATRIQLAHEAARHR